MLADALHSRPHPHMRRCCNEHMHMCAFATNQTRADKAHTLLARNQPHIMAWIHSAGILHLDTPVPVPARYLPAQALPGSVGALASLVILRLSHNRLATLPLELGALAALEVLAADHNALTAVPGAASRPVGRG